MPKHKKPTKKELKAVQKETEVVVKEIEEKEISELPKKSPEKAPVVKSVEPKKTPKKKKVVKKEEPSDETKEALKVEVKEKTKKLSASARENQKIYAKNRVINKALADADELPDPTEEDLQKEFKDWDVMNDTERVFAKEAVISRRFRKTIKTAKDQAKKIVKWGETVTEFIENPVTLNDNPELEGKEEEFTTFANQEANNSVPLSLLALNQPQRREKCLKKEAEAQIPSQNSKQARLH